MASWDEFDEDSVGVASIDDNFEEASLGGDVIAISGDVFVAEDPVADGDVRKRERSFFWFQVTCLTTALHILE